MWYDTYIAQLMGQERTLFPEGWIFGNQYYVIATPVVSAICYLLCHNSVLAMSIASTIMIFVILLTCIWLSYPIKENLPIVLMCILGGVILGTNAAEYINGFQLFYTMCSYYASYLAVTFYVWGIYCRLKMRITVRWFHLVVSVMCVFLIGMNSLRIMQVLVLPICVIELFDYFFPRLSKTEVTSKRFGTHSILFSAGLFFICIISHLLITKLNIPNNQIIGDFTLNNFGLDSIWNTIKSFLQAAGLALYRDGIFGLLLSFFAFLLLFVNAFAVLSIIGKIIFSSAQK